MAEPTKIDVTTLETPVESEAGKLQPVQGTPEAESLQLGEQTGELQPQAPNPVPASAAPSTDQVTINSHLRKVNDELNSVLSYVKGFLGEHPVAGTVVKTLEDAITVVSGSIK